MKIDFEMTDGKYTLRDAIHLPDNHGYTDAEIESMKQARFDKWLEILNTPVETPAEDQEPQEVLDQDIAV